MENGVIVAYDQDGLPVVSLDVGLYGREVLTEVHRKLIREISNAFQWFDDPAVPFDLKDQNVGRLQDMQARQLYIFKLAQTCGCSQSELMKHLDLPF